MGRLEAVHLKIVMEITLLIMENHGIVFLNFCGNPVLKPGSTLFLNPASLEVL